MIGHPCARVCKASDIGEPDQLYDLRAAVEQMRAHEDAGGDGWWKGWEMLKTAYDMATPPKAATLLEKVETAASKPASGR